MLQVAYLLHGVVTCLTKETIWRGSEQISNFIPFILVDERRTEAYGLQNKMTSINDFFFLLNGCLTIKKRKKRKVEWETIILTHVAPGVRPLPLVLLVWVCPAGFQKSQRARFRLLLLWFLWHPLQPSVSALPGPRSDPD